MIWRRKRVFRIWSALLSHRLALTESWLVALISMLHCCVSCMGKMLYMSYMKCNSVRKEDDFVTVCVLCTLSFWKIMLTKYYCCWFTLSLHIRFLLEWRHESNFRGGFLKVYHSRFIIPLSLLIVNIWKMEIWHSVAQFHYLVFPTCCSCVLLSNPHLSCLSSLSGCVSNIVQCSTLEYLIKKKKRKKMGLVGQIRTVF